MFLDSSKSPVSIELSPIDSTCSVEPPSEAPQVEKATGSKAHRNLAHGERPNNNGKVVRDVIIGFADGLTVPFALTAGLSSHVAPS
jgi:hypothetical protein